MTPHPTLAAQPWALWEITFTYRDDAGDRAEHRRHVIGDEPDTEHAERSADTVPAPVRAFAELIAATYAPTNAVESIRYAVDVPPVRHSAITLGGSSMTMHDTDDPHTFGPREEW